MGIAKQVVEALTKLHKKDADGALIPVSIAIDATSKKQHGASGRSVYKQFIRDNLALITRISFGATFGELNLKVPDTLLAKCEKMKVNDEGCCGIDEILYHVVRCGLLHEAELPKELTVHFKDAGTFVVKPDYFEIPGQIIFGLATAVICSPINSDEHIETDMCLQLGGIKLPLNKIWGKKDKLWNLLEATREFET